MASVTNYSGYNQAGAQQAYGSYAAQPAQGYGQTAQGYTQQDYSSYAQPAATDSTYGQSASSAGGYTQQQYAASYAQSTAPAAYGTAQAGAQGYTQPAQAYGTSSYASTTTTAAAAAPPATQASYGTQSGYTAQSPYSGYGQQSASASQSYSASTQPAYSQGTYQAQQQAYGGQQQSAYTQGPPQQPPSTAYPPPSNGSYAQPPYSQPGAPQSGYDQSGPYGGYGQGRASGAYVSSQQSQRGGYPGDGPGRDGYDRLGMRGAPRGRGPMGRGMGMAGDRGGFSKPGGPMREGMEGHPEQQDESENSTIYITGLTEKVTLTDMADFFKHSGTIRINRRLNQPAINIYTDKDSGKPKGDATLSYDEPPCARAAVEYFNGKEFQGRRLNVSMARRKTVPGLMRGGMAMRGGPNMMDRGGMMGRGGDRGGFSPRGGPRGPWPGEDHQELTTSQRELETGSVLTPHVETRTLPGGPSVTSAKLQDLRAWHLLQVETVAEAGCSAGAEGSSGVALGGCVEVGQENPGASGVAEGEWTEEDSGEEVVEDRQWTVGRGEGWDQGRWI
ncbi:hypothetical protein HF521_014395 [Silurus meridionalis]|uniref:RRM domain-containing protein n=1 Tax=Silurus meridionalis TaxID=175797 RepID=A0A8T0A7F5_SILME|nr:hypothetical protein HF521_014395 [Silurus meridionalis]